MFAKTRLALLVGWVTGGVAFPLLAQETTKNETIVVTSQMQSGATKIATPDIETPQSVSIITREQFEEQGISTKWNRIITDDGGKTTGNPGVFSGGDCVSGPATVIKAIAAGKVVAANIDEYLGYHHEITVDVDIPSPLMNDKLPSGRIHLTEREACERKNDFDGIENAMSREETIQEAARCLRCDHYGCGVLRGGRELRW